MNKNTIDFIKKVFIISILIIILINIGEYFLNASTNKKSTKIINNNDKIYKTQTSKDLGRIGVAISTNLGTSFSQINNTPAIIYKEIFSISDLVRDENIKDELIGKNMIIIKDYLNVLKTDIKSLLSTSYDKRAILNAYIEQLEFRYNNGVENQKLLTTQRDIFIASMNDADSKIENLKVKINNDFINSDSKASLENIDEYLKLKQESNYAKTYIIYINHFLAQYSFLNDYSKNLAGILIYNKEAILKDAYVVIPENGGIEALKQFNLIYEESEYTSKK